MLDTGIWVIDRSKDNKGSYYLGSRHLFNVVLIKSVGKSREFFKKDCHINPPFSKTFAEKCTPSTELQPPETKLPNIAQNKRQLIAF